MRILIRLAAFALRYPRRLPIACLSTIGAGLFALVIPRLLGDAVDVALQNRALGELVSLALAILVASVLRGICAFGQMYLGESLGQKVAYDIRNAFYDRLQRLSFSFFDDEQTGNLMSKATADVEGIRMFIQMAVARAGYMVLLVCSVAVLLFLLNWRLALVSLSFVPIIAWRTGLISLQMRRTWTLVQTEMGHLTTVLQENLVGQRVVKAFAAEDHEKEKFHARAQNVAEYEYRATVLHASNSALNNFFFLGGTGLILWFGGLEAIAGRLTPGELTQFILYLGLLAIPVRMAGWLVNTFARAISSGERVLNVLDLETQVKEKTTAVVLPRVKGHVLFEAVSFGYDPARLVIRNVTFEARPGQRIAFLGTPGSGKTTIAHLIPRFYDVTDGRITIDGIDVREATLASLRSNVGIVQQDVFIFTASIRDNIAYGADNASMKKVIEVARLAQIHDFIQELPLGYDTRVGERGVTLSGGQRQRLAIARTLLLDPPILLLDDSTSSVDSETEQALHSALQVAMQGRTTFVIAHRLSTLRESDLILVLEDGEIVQRGTHNELVSHFGPYREIYELQLRPQIKDGLTLPTATLDQSDPRSQGLSFPSGEGA